MSIARTKRLNQLQARSNYENLFPPKFTPTILYLNFCNPSCAGLIQKPKKVGQKGTRIGPLLQVSALYLC